MRKPPAALARPPHQSRGPQDSRSGRTGFPVTFGVGRSPFGIITYMKPTDFNQQMSARNRAGNLGFFFDAAVREVPDKVAVIDLFGGRERQVTYRALDARMDRVAAMLAGLGARPGERIGMLVGNRIEFLEIFFGAMRMGAIPVILNTRLAATTLTAIFAEAGCRIALIDPAFNRNAGATSRGPLRAHTTA